MSLAPNDESGRKSGCLRVGIFGIAVVILGLAGAALLCWFLLWFFYRNSFR